MQKWTYQVNKKTVIKQRPGDPPWPGEVYKDNWVEVSKIEYDNTLEQKMKSRKVLRVEGR